MGLAREQFAFDAETQFSHWSGHTRVSAMHAGSFSGFPPALLTTATSDWVEKCVPLDSRALATLDKTRRLAIALENTEEVYIVRSQSATQQFSNLELLMPYVRGRSGPSILIHAFPSDLKAFRLSLSSFFDMTANYAVARPVSVDIIARKAATLDLTQSPKLEAIRKEFVVRLGRYGELASLEGLCHGDLSLGNMVFHGNAIHLLDALPVFYESPLQDAAKLLIEAKYGLSDFSAASDLRAQLRIAWRYAIPPEVTHYAQEFPTTVSALAVVHILRMYPYALKKNEDLARWLETTAETALNEFADDALEI